MGIAERKEREKEQRRNSIIDAAERIFFGKGMQNATMDEIADEAEVSKGTLYLYFKSRDDLALAIHLRGQAILRDMFREAVDLSLNGLDQVTTFGRTYYRFYQKYPDYFLILVYFDSHLKQEFSGSPNADVCAEKGMEILSLIVEAIERGQKDGSIRQELTPIDLAILLWGQSMGVIQVYAVNSQLKGLRESGCNVEELYETSVRLIGRSLSTECRCPGDDCEKE